MAVQQYRIHIRQGEFELDVEGDRVFVETYMEAFLSDEADLELEGEDVKGALRATKAGRGKRPARGKRAAPKLDAAALTAFMKGRGTSSNKQRYLEYMRFWSAQGVKEVDDAHIHACFMAEELPVPPTGRQNFGSLRGDGLVKAGSRRGFWTLTPAAGGGRSAKTGPARKPAVKPAKKAAGKPAKKTAGKPAKKAAGKPKPAKAASKPKASRKKKAAKRRPAKAPAPAVQAAPAAE